MSHLASPAAMPNATKRVGRMDALDGLRGFAALIVFAHHALVLLYSPLAGINEHHLPVRPRLVYEAMQNLPVAWVFNGTFAVSFFFVLSGFVLTRAMGTRVQPEKVAQLIAARFLRLLPLVILGTLFGYAVFTPAVRHVDMLCAVTGHTSVTYIDHELIANHGIVAALKQCLFTIWRGARADALFDPPLWSIGVELKGSLLVYLLAGTFAQTRRRSAKYWVGVPLGICFMGPATLSFLAGMYLAERSLGSETLLPLKAPALSLLALVALTWASVHPWDRTLWLPLPFNPPEIVDTAVSTLCSVFLMAAGQQLRVFRALLNSALAQFLGRASYGLYVLHVPIFYLGAAPVLAYFRKFAGLDVAAIGTSLFLLVLSLVLGNWLIVHVDTPLAQRSKAWVNQWLKQGPALDT